MSLEFNMFMLRCISKEGGEPNKLFQSLFTCKHELIHRHPNECTHFWLEHNL